jgi:hypothetical protein
MSTATTFVRPAGWSYDRRAVTFGRDIFDDAFISLEDLADPLHYRSITERLISAQPSIAPWGAYVAPMNWATWTATAVLLSPALVDGRVLLVDPDQLGVVVNGDPDVERFWARHADPNRPPSGCLPGAGGRRGHGRVGNRTVLAAAADR